MSTTRRAALLTIATGALACSGVQHPSGSVDPTWLAALDDVVAFARAVEPAACVAIVALVPGAAGACGLADTSLDLLADALAGYRAARGAETAACALRAAADAALAARMDVTQLLAPAGPGAGHAVAMVAGMLSFAIDAFLPPCASAADAAVHERAIVRLRSAVAPGAVRAPAQSLHWEVWPWRDVSSGGVR